ncbi:MAG: hypothetical protein GY820_01505 [Gammaproteobacteria bacterium]|nr:hypothetical protein [Gammaproteobacteria bacterium]
MVNVANDNKRSRPGMACQSLARALLRHARGVTCTRDWWRDCCLAMQSA